MFFWTDRYEGLGSCLSDELDRPEGAFYAYPNLTGLLGRELAGRTASSTLELADLVLEEANVAFVPGEAFGTPGYARFSFAMDTNAMVEGIERIKALVEG